MAVLERLAADAEFVSFEFHEFVGDEPGLGPVDPRPALSRVIASGGSRIDIVIWLVFRFIRHFDDGVAVAGVLGADEY